ncbi:MAG TPA: GDSL-type esterase/lipase family protein, partial [Opitutaceae bacterium]|nr:GDSL-type esterase/lipase family protein [Opitutaceae bacterium]
MKFARSKAIVAILAACSLAIAMPAAIATEQTIIFFGDSITAGYGLENPDEAFPGLIGARIEAADLPYKVVNAGLSGETSAGGLRRVDWILRQPCDVFVLGLGGNDGLRGIEPAEIERNLIAILAKVRAKNPDAALVVAGMQIFPSMGEDYRSAYQAAFPAAGAAAGAAVIPF